MKIIPLTRNKYTLIDDDDFFRLSQYKWYYTDCGYAARRKNKGKVWMHREILKTPRGLLTDHINGNRLVNRKRNLRIVNDTQNAINRIKAKNKSSLYKGVSWRKDAKRWRAMIIVNKKEKHLGYFNDERQAAFVYNKFAIENFGKFSKINIL